MKRFGYAALGFVAVLLLATPAFAQRGQRGFGGGFGANPATLLTQESVIKELKLSEDQVTKAREFQKSQAGGFQDFANLSQEEIQKRIAERTKAAEKFVADTLKPEQAKRLNEISLQVRGLTQSLGDAKVSEALKLSDEQREKIKAIQADALAAQKELFQGGGGGNFQELQKKLQEFRKSTDSKLLKTLTADQQTKWKELTGAPFDTSTIQFGGRGRRGGG
jgi:hypothetical protein